MARMQRMKKGKGKRLKKSPSPSPSPPPPPNPLPHLPSDIIFQNILPKLPVRSLLMFKTVSKSWNSTISNPIFAKTHLLSNQTNNLLCFLWKPKLMSPLFCFLKFENQKFETKSVVEFPLQRYRHAVLLSACDGLLLLKDALDPNNNMYVLWNPSTRTYTQFSSPYPFRILKYAHGLCYDPFNHDYKVVYIARDFYSSFSFKNNSWTDKKTLSLAFIKSGCGLIVGGTLHWLLIQDHHLGRGDLELEELLQKKQCGECKDASATHYIDCPIYESDYEQTHEIMYFNARYDKLEKLPKPECFDDTVVFNMTNLRGHLCLYRNTYDKTKIQVWMMKEYGDPNSWMKFLTIENVPMPHPCGRNVRSGRNVKPLYLTEDNEIVLAVSTCNFILYNIKKNTFGEIQVYYGEQTTPYPSNTATLSPLLCPDSLLLLPFKINNNGEV